MLRAHIDQTKLAKVLSIIFGPQLWLPLLLLVVIFKTGLSSHQIQILLPVIFVFQVLTPLAYLHLSPRLGLSKAWDLPKRADRYLFLLITGLGLLISAWFVYSYGNLLLIHLGLIVIVIMLITFLITLFWKISLHMSLMVCGCLIISYLFNWNLGFIYLAIPVIFWARLRLKSHTFSQLAVPIFLDTSIGLGMLYFFGELNF